MYKNYNYIWKLYYIAKIKMNAKHFMQYIKYRNVVLLLAAYTIASKFLIKAIKLNM